MSTPLPIPKIQNLDFNIPAEVSNISVANRTKGKSYADLKMRLQSPFFEVKNYYNNDTVIMPVMMIRIINLEEEMIT